MNALFDIGIVVVILLCTALGYKRGFVKTVMNVLSFVIAFFMARAFAPRLAGYLFARHIQPNFLSSAARQIERFITPSVDLHSLANNPNPPPNFVNLIQGYGFDLADIQNWLRGAGTGADSTEYIAANLAEPVAERFSYFLAFILILAAVFIVLKIAGRIIDGLVKLPGLNFINKTGGIAVGFIYGIAACWILVFLASYALPYLEANGVISSWAEIRDETIFFKWFYENSPISGISGIAGMF